MMTAPDPSHRDFAFRVLLSERRMRGKAHLNRSSSGSSQCCSNRALFWTEILIGRDHTQLCLISDAVIESA
ncbi:hypothetical protein FQN60_002884, partial [Etheostoma spectabile]